MKLAFWALCIFALASCAQARRAPTPGLADSNRTYFLKDPTGEFSIQRSVKRSGSKIVVKKEVYALNELNEPLEKTVSVSVLGNVKGGKSRRPSLRPDVAQHTIWYDRKRYFAQLKLNSATKALDVYMESPEEEWSGRRSFPFPKGAIFCFFSQVPECVLRHGLLENTESPTQLQIIWDNYPYHQEMYENVSSDPFDSGVWAFDRNMPKGRRFGLVVAGQLVLYEFDADNAFKNMFWVAQGISLTSSGD